MSLIKRLYQWAVPSAARARLWRFRHDTGSFVSDACYRRRRIAAIRVRLGLNCAKCHLNDMTFCVDLRDQGVGLPLYVKHSYEPDETAFLKSHLAAGMTVLDIGANIGYFSLLASDLVGPNGSVISFEPDPHNFQLLRKNIRLNKRRNVTALNLALGRSNSTATLYRSRSNFGAHTLTEEILSSCHHGGKASPVSVSIAALDSILEKYCVQPVDFIKIDVQGYEPAVLDGMLNTITRSPSLTILSEFWPPGIERAGESPEKYMELLLNQRFTLSVLNSDGGLIPISSYSDLARRTVAFSSDPEGQYVNIVCRR